jgi:hypothetical protein
MRANTRWHLAAALLGLCGGALLLTGAAPGGADPPPKPGDGPGVGQLKPRWRPGQKWEVETIGQQIPFGDRPKVQQKSKPLLWEFTVLEPQKLGDQNCIRVQVQAKTGGRTQPLTTLWLDEKSLAIRQVQTQLPVQGTLRTVTESYQFASGQPAPVLTPLTAIPLDMPVFLEGTKGVKFTYEAVSGAEGKKDPNDVGFAFEVEQEVNEAGADAVKGLQAKGLLSEDFTKDLQAKPLVEVRLKAGRRKVQQLWQAGLPWPAYSNNGVTQARLVRVLPPPKE